METAWTAVQGVVRRLPGQLSKGPCRDWRDSCPRSRAEAASTAVQQAVWRLPGHFPGTTLGTALPALHPPRSATPPTTPPNIPLDSPPASSLWLEGPPVMGCLISTLAGSTQPSGWAALQERLPAKTPIKRGPCAKGMPHANRNRSVRRMRQCCLWPIEWRDDPAMKGSPYIVGARRKRAGERTARGSSCDQVDPDDVVLHGACACGATTACERKRGHDLRKSRMRQLDQCEPTCTSAFARPRPCMP